jgi:nucleotide-binding universal stress UspA family protein
MTLTPEIIQNMAETAELLAKHAAQSAHRSFLTAAKQANAEIVERPKKAGGATASYREVTGYLPRVLSEAAYLTDLVVLPPVAHSDDTEVHDAFISVLTRTGRPVLLAPQNAPAHVGQKVAVGWDGRGAAASALLTALPFLDKAARVEILSVQHLPPEDHSIDDARDYLALRGIGCIERIIEPGKRQIADVLLDAAQSDECDLLVVGGYGHSRLGETIFGGVTQSVVSHPSLPVLMVH